jgi:hypothetical protein
MGSPDDAAQRPYRIAITIVTVLGLYHGAVPLVMRGLFDRDQRFAPAVWLPAPWWWIACLAVIASAVAVVVVLDDARQRRVPPTGPPAIDSRTSADDLPNTTDPATDRAGALDALSGLVFLVGLYNGVAPLVARLVFDANLLLALPLRLPAPWWWLTSLAVIVASVLLLAAIEHTKQRPGDR